MDNLASEVRNLRSPYSIVLNDKNINYNEKLFGKATQRFITEDDVIDTRRKRSVKDRQSEFERFKNPMTKNEAPSFRPKLQQNPNYDTSEKITKEGESQRVQDDVYNRSQYTRFRRQVQINDCTARGFGKLMKFLPE